jgi:predicted DNA-binding transcriptional regulator AlpA
MSIPFGIGRLLTESEVADYLCIKPSILKSLRSNETGPAYIQLSHKLIRYNIEDVKEWLVKKMKEREQYEPVNN